MAKMTIIELTTIVSNILDIPNRILSKRRTDDIVKGRFIASNLYKRLNPHISVNALAEAFNKDPTNVCFWNKRHAYKMETESDYVIDYNSCCSALGLSINDNTQIDTAIIISELNAEITRLKEQNYKLKQAVSMVMVSVEGVVELKQS